MNTKNCGSASQNEEMKQKKKIIFGPKKSWMVILEALMTRVRKKLLRKQQK